MKSNRSQILAYAFIVLFYFQCAIKTHAQQTPASRLINLKNGMDSIASDNTEGRFTGSIGYLKAAKYVARELENAGLQPGWTNELGIKSFFQPVPFYRYNYDKVGTSITILKAGKRQVYSHSPENFVVINPTTSYKAAAMSAPIFIGYGINEPQSGWDDYRNKSLKGRWVLLLDGMPPPEIIGYKFPAALRDKYNQSNLSDSLKYAALLKHQVAGVILVPNETSSKNWERTVIRSYRFNYIHSVKAKQVYERKIPYILVHPSLASSLFSGDTFDFANKAEEYHAYTLNGIKIRVDIQMKKEFIHCFNVVAKAPGTDSTLQNEYLVVGAHLDHIGKVGTNVYNGANDDASGCVIMLQVAKANAESPTKRPLLFVFYTAEEIGMLGSAHFVSQPPVPKEQILLNINIEQIGSKNRSFPGIWAVGEPKFEKPFYRSAQSFNKSELKYDDIKTWIGEIINTDTGSFYEGQIPSILLSSGGFPEHHSTRDKIDLIDFSHLAKASELLNKLIEELANN